MTPPCHRAQKSPLTGRLTIAQRPVYLRVTSRIRIVDWLEQSWCHTSWIYESEPSTAQDDLIRLSQSENAVRRRTCCQNKRLGVCLKKSYRVTYQIVLQALSSSTVIVTDTPLCWQLWAEAWGGDYLATSHCLLSSSLWPLTRHRQAC